MDKSIHFSHVVSSASFSLTSFNPTVLCNVHTSVYICLSVDCLAHVEWCSHNGAEMNNFYKDMSKALINPVKVLRSHITLLCREWVVQWIALSQQEDSRCGPCCLAVLSRFSSFLSQSKDTYMIGELSTLPVTTCWPCDRQVTCAGCSLPPHRASAEIGSWRHTALHG